MPFGYNDPVYIGASWTLPIPEPVLNPYDNSNAGGADFLCAPSEVQVTPDFYTNFTGLTYRFYPAFWGDYFNRVYAVPATLNLIDPPLDSPNAFALFNANIYEVNLSDTTIPDGTGLEVDFTSLTLKAIGIKTVGLIVTPAAPLAEKTSLTFTWDDDSETPLAVFLSRTSLIAQIPEQPLNVTYSWKTVIDTAKDGTESRSSIRAVHRVSYDTTIIFQDEDEQNLFYRQLMVKGKNPITFPIWDQPIKLLTDARAGDASLDINLSRYDVQNDDTLIMLQLDGTYEVVTVLETNTTFNTASLYSTLTKDFSKSVAFYRLQSALLPQNPQLDRGAINDLQTQLTITLTDARYLFLGNADTQEITKTLVLGDRIITDVVYTLSGVPVLHARPIVRQSLQETFNWNYEVVDYDTGVITQTSYYTEAKVSFAREYLSRYYYQEHYLNFLMDYMHGQRKPIWLPTWQNEVGDQILSVAADTLNLAGVTFADEFPVTSSHRGLWIEYNGGWIARQITDVYADGDTTVVKITPSLPDDFPITGPYKMGFLVLCRMGSDDVKIERSPLYSFFTYTFTSTAYTDSL